MAILSEDRSTYTIVSLDLNKLKQVNDTLGHHEGDRLIVGFATILSECFWDANLIGRMGGDEFIVVMTDEHALNCTKRIHELYNIISEWNSKEQSFQYSASYGYAYSYEVPNGLASEVYMLADSRMYEMKKEHRNDNRKEVENA
jgi:diguanylate cyclase (GGDEF)-like protein